MNQKRKKIIAREGVVMNEEGKRILEEWRKKQARMDVIEPFKEYKPGDTTPCSIREEVEEFLTLHEECTELIKKWRSMICA